MLRRILIAVAPTIALGIGILVGLYSSPAAAAGYAAGYHIPNSVFTTQDGKNVHFYNDLVKGKVVAIDFVYTNCHFSCPLETARMVQVQKLLADHVGRDIFFISVSIDPQHDTPAQLKAYMQKFHVGPGWTFLTGRKADVDLLARDLGITDYNKITSAPGRTIDGHTPELLIGNDRTGQWSKDTSTDNPYYLADMLTTDVGGRSHQFAAGGGGGAVKLDTGQYVFNKNCAPCHTIGHGDRIGPDLAGVTRRRKYFWLMHYIQDPHAVIASHDPIATALHAKYKVTMPNLRLGPIDVAAVLNYLSAQDSAAASLSLANHAGGDDAKVH